MPPRKTLVSNASPLIYLARIGELDIIRKLFGTVIVPRKDLLEVTSGSTLDSRLIQRAIDRGWIKVWEGEMGDEPSALARVTGLNSGEAEALILAGMTKSSLLVDEREAVGTALMMDVETIGTVGVLLTALAKEEISFRRLIRDLDDLMVVGFWLRPDVYRRAVEAAERLWNQGKKRKPYKRDG